MNTRSTPTSRRSPDFYGSRVRGAGAASCGTAYLVCKAFVAAQNGADPDVLILIRFASIAEQMGETLLTLHKDRGRCQSARADLAGVGPRGASCVLSRGDGSAGRATCTGGAAAILTRWARPLLPGPRRGDVPAPSLQALHR